MRERVVRQPNSNGTTAGPESRSRTEQGGSTTGVSDKRVETAALQRLKFGIEGSKQVRQASQFRSTVQRVQEASHVNGKSQNRLKAFPLGIAKPMVQLEISATEMQRRVTEMHEFAVRLGAVSAHRNRELGSLRSECLENIDRGADRHQIDRSELSGLIADPAPYRDVDFNLDGELEVESQSKLLQYRAWCKEAIAEATSITPKEGQPVMAGDLIRRYQDYRNAVSELHRRIEEHGRAITECNLRIPVFRNGLNSLQRRIAAKAEKDRREEEKRKLAESQTQAVSEEAQSRMMRDAIAVNEQILARHRQAQGQSNVPSQGAGAASARPAKSAANQTVTAASATAKTTTQQPSREQIDGKKSEINLAMRVLNHEIGQGENALEASIQKAVTEKKIGLIDAQRIRALAPMERIEFHQETLMRGLRLHLQADRSPLLFTHQEIARLMVQLESCTRRLALCTARSEALENSMRK